MTQYRGVTHTRLPDPPGGYDQGYMSRLVSDVGNTMSDLSRKVYAMVSSGVGAPLSRDINADANGLLAARRNSPFQLHTTPLTANRALVLSDDGAVSGSHFRITRTGVDAFTLSVGGLKNLASGQWCEVMHDGTGWKLVAFGNL